MTYETYEYQHQHPHSPQQHQQHEVMHNTMHPPPPPSASYNCYPLKHIPQPHAHDVLCGRGGQSNSHPGNTQWRMLVAANKELYVSLPKKQKMLLSQSIVNAVRSQNPPGRFLQKDNKGNEQWYDVGDKRAQEKTSQALREGAPEIRIKLLKEKQHEEIVAGDIPSSSTTEVASAEAAAGDAGAEAIIGPKPPTATAPSSTPTTDETTSTSCAGTTTEATVTTAVADAEAKQPPPQPPQPSSSSQEAEVDGPSIESSKAPPPPTPPHPQQQQQQPHVRFSNNSVPTTTNTTMEPMPEPIRQPSSEQMPPPTAVGVSTTTSLRPPNDHSSNNDIMAPPPAVVLPPPPPPPQNHHPIPVAAQGAVAPPHQEMHGMSSDPRVLQQQFPHRYSKPAAAVMRSAKQPKAPPPPPQQQQEQPINNLAAKFFGQPQPPLPPAQLQQQHQQQQYQDYRNGDNTDDDEDDDVAMPPPSMDPAGEFSFGSMGLMTEAEQACLMNGVSFGTNISYDNKPNNDYNNNVPLPVDGGLEPIGLSFGSMMSVDNNNTTQRPMPRLEGAGLSFGSTMSYTVTGNNGGRRGSYGNGGAPMPTDGGLQDIGTSFGSLSLAEGERERIIAEAEREMAMLHTPPSPPGGGGDSTHGNHHHSAAAAAGDVDANIVNAPTVLKLQKSKGNLLDCSDSESEDEETSAEASAAQKSAEWEKLQATLATQDRSLRTTTSDMPPPMFGGRQQQHNPHHHHHHPAATLNIPASTGGLDRDFSQMSAISVGDDFTPVPVNYDYVVPPSAAQQQEPYAYPAPYPAHLTHPPPNQQQQHHHYHSEMPPPPPEMNKNGDDDDEAWKELEYTYLNRGNSLADEEFNEDTTLRR